MILSTAFAHPEYSAKIEDWTKFRQILISGRKFVDEYLEKFSESETDSEFNSRKDVSYNPAFAKSLLLEIKNAIYQRMADVRRSGGDETYRSACEGELGGVDNSGSAMESFIGSTVLEELLGIGKVGIYVDKEEQSSNRTKAANQKHPYLYIFKAEDILSWDYTIDGVLTTLLLRSYAPAYYEKTSLVKSYDAKYSLYTLTPDGVRVQEFSDGGLTQETSSQIIDLPEIPFIVAELPKSLLQDVADYQIALLNLVSSDLAYALHSNFPFYTEQFDARVELSSVRRSSGGDSETANAGGTPGLNLGSKHGRRYPLGVERPGYISPPSDPLKVSMEKQEQMKNEMRLLLGLNVASLNRSSADAKVEAQKGLEAGLSYIGLVLERVEQQISNLWAMYQVATPAIVKYPTKYSLKSDAQVYEEAKTLQDFRDQIPSITFKKHLSTEIAAIIMANRIPVEEMEKIRSEIEKSPVIITDAETIKLDHEAGFVSTETASKLRGYPEGEHIQAAKDHAERAKRIAAAQSSIKDAGARGVDDLSNDPNAAKKEKQQE
jgi:hypothetical protein